MSQQESPHFNILTRTANRPNFFEALCKSIDEQDYKNWSHHVITDDPASSAYIESQRRTPTITTRLKKREDINHHFPYNLYVNELYRNVSEGYILLIDDDDCFLTSKALSFLANVIERVGNLPTLFWRVQFPDGLIPRETENFVFRPTNIASCGFCFHTKFIDAAKWDEFKESDFRVAHKIKLASDAALYLRGSVLTGLQRASGMGGRGVRDDLLERSQGSNQMTA